MKHLPLFAALLVSSAPAFAAEAEDALITASGLGVWWITPNE